MGALEDDLDYGLRVQRDRNRQSHTLVNSEARWDDMECTACGRQGGVALSFNECDKKAGSTVHAPGCECGFCKMGYTRL